MNLQVGCQLGDEGATIQSQIRIHISDALFTRRPLSNRTTRTRQVAPLPLPIDRDVTWSGQTCTHDFRRVRLPSTPPHILLRKDASFDQYGGVPCMAGRRWQADRMGTTYGMHDRTQFTSPKAISDYGAATMVLNR
jgi:hypothetical protein